MSRDYNMLHMIQNNMAGVDKRAIDAVSRMYERLEKRECYASCVSTSVTLVLAFKYMSLNPKLILGTVQYQGISHPHAWIELDGKIFDLAISVDIKYHPVLKEREMQRIEPIINLTHDEAVNNVKYYPYQFGGTWKVSNMYQLVGKTMKEYADASPVFDIWADICYILDISETAENLTILEHLAEQEIIRDKEIM